MPRRSKKRQLATWMNGEKVGHWSIDAQGQHEFRYEKAWLAEPDARPLSLSMPLRPSESPYSGPLVEAFFDNLLPDSTDIRRRVQSHFGTQSTSPFDLLAEIGRDCVGAVQLLATDKTPEGLRQIQGQPLNEDGVAKVLRQTVSAAPLGQREEDSFRISIAGAQEKTALLWHEEQWHQSLGSTPSTHIFKLPLGRVGNFQADLTTSVENEWLCAKILNAYGIETAKCEIADFQDQHTLIVERFDRRLARSGEWWLRLPQEDLCQATGTPAGQKYEVDGGPGISRINSLLLGSRNASVDRRNFFKSQVVFWMLCAIDGHAKNFSVFIEPSGRYSLTPLYDVMSAYPILGTKANQLAPQKAKMAMAAIGKNRHYNWAEIQPRHWLSTAAACGLETNAPADIAAIVARTPKVVDAVSSMLPEGFPAGVADTIFDGITDAARRLDELA
jgi:serine/threonine-protein kinase HipA